MIKAKIAGILASTILLALCTGCSTKTADSLAESEPTSAATASLSVSAGSSSSIAAKSQIASSTPTVSSQQTAVSSSSSKPQTSHPPASTAAPSSRESTPAAPAAEKPAAQTPPSEEAPTPRQAPASQATPPPAPSSTPAPSSAPAFDVSQWVNLGISYGQSIGLEADSSVTGSWDNPIIAGSGSQYLERDICGMLDWYKASGFTRFWVWASPRNDGKYDLYIGYS